MAFSTLDDLRADLNADLGLGDDTATAPWGSQTVRNTALQDALRRMWPRMARLIREDVTIVAEATEYDLTDIRDLETIEVYNSDGRVYKEIRNFRAWDDHEADPVVTHFLLTTYWQAGTTDTIKAVGYAPYTVPATGGASLDLPPELEYIAIHGARAYLYRRRFNQWVDFEQQQVQNRDNASSPSELFAMYQDAERLFNDAVEQNGRRMALPKTARLRRGRR